MLLQKKRGPKAPWFEFSDDDRWRRREAKGGKNWGRTPMMKLRKYHLFGRFDGKTSHFDTPHHNRNKYLCQAIS